MKLAPGWTWRNLTAVTISSAAWSLAACSATAALVVHQARAAKHSTDRPVPSEVAHRLPAGIFYLLAGPNASSLNIWEISNSGRERRLTNNRVGYGIDSFSASRPGIVMSDAESGIDALARLGPRGPVFSPDGHVGSVQIAPSGRVAYDRPASKSYGPYFEIVFKKNFWAPVHVIYKQKATLYAEGWGPRKAQAVVSAANANDQGPFRLLTIDPHGNATTVHTGFHSVGYAVWSTKAPGIAITSRNRESELVRPDGALEPIPNGWRPAAWNASGKQLLMYSFTGHCLGVWNPEIPKHVTRIGILRKRIFYGPIAWLAKQAAR